MAWTIKKLAEICQGKALNVQDINVNSYAIDTRTIMPGEVYIGIKGENHDGSSFYEEAIKQGAAALILSKDYINNSAQIKIPVIFVDDTKKALANLASVYLEELNIPVVAITGSVGKTSTKDIIYAILSQRYKVFKPIKNYNNSIGLPLSILSIKDENIAVLEMGMSELGEISYLSQIAKPNVAVITNVLPVHIESLKTIDNILKAKLEIIDGLKKDGVLVINNDNESLFNAKIDFDNIITCGIEKQSDLKVSQITDDYFVLNYESNQINIPYTGLTKKFIQNILLGIAVGINFGISFEEIINALKDVTFTSGRLENISLKNNILLINDAYNANTESMKNAIDYLIKQKGKRKIAILGNIRELGEYSKKLHIEVGKYINNNIDYLITIGDDAKYIYDSANLQNKKHFETKDELFLFLEEFITSQDTIIIKASNGENFIEIVDFFEKHWN